MDARDWRIYGSGNGGWYAWNGRARRWKNLVDHGSFSEAVEAFEKKIGPYWESRSQSPEIKGLDPETELR